ncbi:hypothetical protein B0H13DRAFT_2232606 [Mycena leptocephala]|nr:hypothetical protein B0H13DRAFT_2232606 [Mycena leptocephala]
MHRRFSSLVKSPKASGSASVEFDDDTESKVSTIVRDEPLPPASSKIKRVDYFYSRWSKGWKYKNMNSKVTVETLPEYSFVVVRTIPQQENRQPTFKIVIKSEYILKACQDVIQTWPGVSWHADPLELEPEIFLTWLQSFTEYRDALAAKKRRTEQETHVLSSVNLLLSFLTTDYRNTIASIERLTSHGEITFDLLYAILVPRTLVVARCAVTGLERLFQLQSFTRTAVEGVPVYQLALEGVDLVDRPLTQTVKVGRVATCVYIPYFKGAVRIDSLDAFPLRFHANEKALREEVGRRGQKWVELIGVHHMQYSGIAALRVMGKLMRHNVKGRIMVDRATFHRLNPNYSFPVPVPPKNPHDDDPNGMGMHGMNHNNGMNGNMAMGFDAYGQPVMLPPPGQRLGIVSLLFLTHSCFCVRVNKADADVCILAAALMHTRENATNENADLSAEELLLTPTVVYGFSLADKIWLEFDVTKVAPVDWNADAFANLVLPADRKTLLRSLVEAHHEEAGLTTSQDLLAEATSEHVQRPLYVIGGGDLGTRAADLDASLERVFDVATAWKAIVLIDEADVFLERRSLHDWRGTRCLRHVEYYRGILFLTTNRVQAFDEAFLSRIHIQISEEEIAILAKREVNGRQIKNAVRTAHSLARARKESVGLGHFVETLDAMDEFTENFEGMRGLVEAGGRRSEMI